MHITVSIPTLLRLKNVHSSRGIGKSQHYDDIQNGIFTPPIKIGIRASASPTHEVAAINAACIAGKSDDQIRRLVIDLIIARSAGCDI